MKLNVLPAAIAALLATNSFANTSAEEDRTVLDPITVSADLRDINIDKIAASVSVLNELEIQDRGATHFDDVLLQLPNVNFAGQSSRARHIQIRGQGERDEYTGAPNSSVGFALDDIDLSSIGMVANMFDIKQVEVLRGPQGTRFGANAIAGLINIQSNEPTPYRENLIELTGGQDSLTEIGLMTSGSFNEEETNSPLYRFSLFKHDSDGAFLNDHLGKDDTNGRDELSLRGKLRFTPNDDTQIDLTLIHADLDNGYDAWTLNNSYTTLSDDPGKDTQETTAGAVKVLWDGNDNFTLTSITTLAKSDMKYSSDWDWVYEGYYADLGGYGDNFRAKYNNDKTRKTVSQEFRLTSTEQSRIFNDSTDWLIGVYGSQLKEDNQTTTSTVGSSWDSASNLTSDYKVRKLATFGQLDHHLSDKTVLSFGMRIENQDAKFSNSNNESHSPTETFFGGHMTLTHAINDQHNAYLAIARGYKAGGFNTGLSAGADTNLLTFKKETAINYELGLKSSLLENTLKTAVTLFYTDRKDAQFDGSATVNGGDWIFYTENFDTAKNYGLEAEFDWKTNKNWNIFGSLGLIKTTVEGVSYADTFTVNGRDQAHAPSYQYNVGTQYRNNKGFFARADVTGLDSFYFSNSNTAKSEAYRVTNARIGYEANKWEVYLWAKNIFDKKYATRGFLTELDPDWSIEEKYIRLGDPRQFGVTARMRF